MHDRRAEAAHDPRPDAGVRDEPQVVEVLDQREAGAHCEAEDRGVDEEADAMRANQRDDDEPFQNLLDDRRDVAREVRRGPCAARSSTYGVDQVAQARDDCADATTATTARSFTSL